MRHRPSTIDEVVEYVREQFAIPPRVHGDPHALAQRFWDFWEQKRWDHRAETWGRLADGWIRKERERDRRPAKKAPRKPVATICMLCWRTHEECVCPTLCQGGSSEQEQEGWLVLQRCWCHGTVQATDPEALSRNVAALRVGVADGDEYKARTDEWFAWLERKRMAA